MGTMIGVGVSPCLQKPKSGGTPPTPDGMRITESGDTRTTEAGDTRVVEDATP